MEIDFTKEPIDHFLSLYNEAQARKVPDAWAFTLATSHNNIPNARVVLFKGIVNNGISFFTNYDSQKSHELNDNPIVTAVFYWPGVFKQVRITGTVEKLDRKKNEEYFSTRPRLSQIGAWASKQSRPIESFDELNQKVKKYETEFQDKEVPCPPNWGGYVINPERFEFWIGREGRLHERYVYEKLTNGWRTQLLSP